MGSIDAVLAELKITLPPAPKPVASYVPFARTGNLVYISGQLPSREGKVLFTGPVGGPDGMPVERAAEGAMLCGINLLAVLKDACGGDLDQVVRIVRLGVFVQSTDGFDTQAKVANGASDLMVLVFGEAGRHARAAVGTNALPLNAAVEVELLAEVR